jgi:hypothetical protein
MTCSFAISGNSLYDLTSKFQMSQNKVTLEVVYSDNLGFDKCVTTCKTVRITRAIFIIKGDGYFIMSPKQLMTLSSIGLACKEELITVRISGDIEKSKIRINTGQISV